ncbi:MAG: TldD/PmbA family protein [Candidatus Aminicenantes bacterium]|nr:TldD/PmbA family protein [Candidatus Aminicenantes bacterium]
MKLPFEDHFGLGPGELRRVLDASLARGGDFAEIFLEYRLYHFVLMEEDIIKETSESVSLGLGIRVCQGEKTGYGFTNDLSAEKILQTAASAAAIAEAGPAGKTADWGSNGLPPPDVYLVREPAHESDLAAKIALVQEAYAACQAASPAVKKVKSALQDQVQYLTVANSEGRFVSDVRPLLKLTCVAIAEKGEVREYGFSGSGGRVGLEHFRDVLTPRAVGADAAREALLLLEARDAPAGEMPVVLSPGHAGVLIHEAVGHLVEADFNRKRTSVFWNKMGERVGSSLVTIYDDPTIPGSRGSYAVDDEGTVPGKTALVDRGILVGLLQDKLSARLMGRTPTGHGRRQDYTDFPIPRMANTFIAAGEDDPADIIRSVQKGLYADRFTGGQVEDSGKFTFSVSSGYLIEGGRLTAPVKQATLIGTNIDILQKVDRVGSDLAFGQQTGTCGKEGQDVPVTDGCPTLRISGMTVGGRE